jgi:hypothetical protein
MAVFISAGSEHGEFCGWVTLFLDSRQLQPLGAALSQQGAISLSVSAAAGRRQDPHLLLG